MTTQTLTLPVVSRIAGTDIAKAPRQPLAAFLLILVIGYVRRRLKRATDATSMLVAAFRDMQEMRRAAQRQYPFLSDL